MRKILIFSFIFFCFFAYGLFLSQMNISVIQEELAPAGHPVFHDYRGITNVHTNRGLGSGSPNSVIRAAREAGLDFLILTDLNVFDAPLTDSYHRQLLVLSTASYSYLESRLLFYDLHRRHSIESLGQSQVLLADLLSQTGRDAESDFIILAHPTKAGFSWKGSFPSGLDGLEIISLKTLWQHAWNSSKLSFIWSVLVYPFNPTLALLRLYEEPQEALDLWDRVSQERSFVGIAGADATAKTGSIGDFYLRFPPYQTSFSLLSNHVLLRSELTGEVNSDRRKILNAMANGNFYMSLDILGNPKGFAAYIQQGEKTYPMGSRLKWEPGTKLVVHLPQKPSVPFEAAFFKDGQHIMSSNSADTEFELHGKGVYRVIVRVFLTLTLPDGNRWMTWIYTNPFYLE